MSETPPSGILQQPQIQNSPGSNSNSNINNLQNRMQDVRVDNWGNYCLQRLQVMYDRGDFCDLTLQFHNNQILKVHRVVVNLCTEYFGNLERVFGLSDGMLILPKDVDYNAMLTIVKFFYTGKLEVRGTQFNDIYRTVKLMNITILTKLLEAHARKPILQAKKEPTKPIVFKQAVEIGRPMQVVQRSPTGGQVIYQNSQTLTSIGHTSPTVTGTTGTRGMTMSRGSLPPGAKTKTVLARVQPKTSSAALQAAVKSISSKKLPIWKERKYSPVSNTTDHSHSWPPKEEAPRPTRFEWNDPDEEQGYYPQVAHNLLEKQKAATAVKKTGDIFESVKSNALGGGGLKRSLLLTAPGNVKLEHLEPVAKLARIGEINSASSAPEEEGNVDLTDETVEEVVTTSNPNTPTNTLSRLEVSIEVSQDSSDEIQQITSKRINYNVKDGNITAGQKREKSVRFSDLIETREFGPLKPKHEPLIISAEGPDAASNHSKIISEVLKKYPDLVRENKNIKLKIVQKDNIVGSPSKEGKSKVSYIVLKSSSSPDTAGSVVLKKQSSGVGANKSTFWDSDKSPKKSPEGIDNTKGPWFCTNCEESPLEFDSYFNFRKHLVDIHGERIDARICEHCGQKSSKRNLHLYHLYTKHGVPPPNNCIFPHCDRCDYVALSDSLLLKHKQQHDISKEFSCTICNASFKSNGALQGHLAANLHRNKDTKVYECPYCRKPFVRNINLKGHIRALHKDVARVEEMDDPRLPPDESLSLITNRSNSSTVNSSSGISGGILAKKRQFPSILTSTSSAQNTTTSTGNNRSATATLLGHGHGQNIILSGGGSAEANELIHHQQHQHQPQSINLVTADGSTIEILQGLPPSSYQSVPVSLVPTSDGLSLSNVATSIAASLGLDASGVPHGAEFVTGVNSDGSPAVYIMDGAQAVEVNVSGVQMGVAPDGSMIQLESHDPNGGSIVDGNDQLIVQDIHGNHFRKITGIDETGKQVIFFQLSDENGQVQLAPMTVGDGSSPQEFNFVTSEEVSVSADQTTFSVQNDHMYLEGSPQKCSVFVPSGMGGMSESQLNSMPVGQVILSDGHHHHQQHHDGTIHPVQMVSEEEVGEGEIKNHEEEQEEQEVETEEGQGQVQELHLVLEQEEEHEQVQEGGEGEGESGVVEEVEEENVEIGEEVEEEEDIKEDSDNTNNDNNITATGEGDIIEGEVESSEVVEGEAEEDGEEGELHISETENYENNHEEEVGNNINKTDNENEGTEVEMEMEIKTIENEEEISHSEEVQIQINNNQEQEQESMEVEQNEEIVEEEEEANK